MAIAEALVLLAMGLLAGILSTVFDVLVFGTASFLSHFSLWVLLNALVAVHVDSRARAIWWAIPFNFGYIEAYFITTVASFESYQKSLMVPLAAVALISPFLTYALWTAKREKNLYGRFLSVLIVAGTLAASYAVNRHLGVYDFVVCTLLALVLLVIPVRRLVIERSAQPVREASAVPAADDAVPKRRRRHTIRKERSKTSDQEAAENAPTQKQARPTRRKRTGDATRSRKPLLSRRSKRRQEDQEREQRLRASSQRRSARRESEDVQSRNATLGNSRVARRSTRRA